MLAPNFVRSVHQTIFPIVGGPVGNLITKSLEIIHQRFPNELLHLNLDALESAPVVFGLSGPTERTHGDHLSIRPSILAVVPVHDGHRLISFSTDPPASRTYLLSTHDHGRPRSKCHYIASSPYVGSDPRSQICLVPTLDRVEPFAR